MLNITENVFCLSPNTIKLKQQKQQHYAQVSEAQYKHFSPKMCLNVNLCTAVKHACVHSLCF